eukprot:CAMPEP_0174743302 /NCGR_PEP_ID=MMETSP1094-20130205/81265_1 /TAXON_ID=156173 /ORGANISM="Chrysochromulina brevifilum, Strain UTEX LB 985" /LENGTH=205 /DNA_ID=CAMNT_0015947499 /DNA_START=242 /DNA_END=858 /DNA_ORIENTATION=-
MTGNIQRAPPANLNTSSDVLVAPAQTSRTARLQANKLERAADRVQGRPAWPETLVTHSIGVAYGPDGPALDGGLLYQHVARDKHGGYHDGYALAEEHAVGHRDTLQLRQAAHHQAAQGANARGVGAEIGAKDDGGEGCAPCVTVEMSLSARRQYGRRLPGRHRVDHLEHDERGWQRLEDVAEEHRHVARYECDGAAGGQRDEDRG